MIKLQEDWLLPNGKYQCPHCNKEYTKNGICTHIWRSHGDGKDFTANNAGYKDGSRKGTNDFIKGTKSEHSQETKKKIGEKNSGNKHTEEFKKARSLDAKKNGLGGVRPSKHIKYKGKTLGSTYEYILAQDLDKHNIEWDTCSRVKYRCPNGKERTYTPDLYLPKYDIYLDPKNDFLINNVNPRLGFKDVDKISWAVEQNNITVYVLDKNQLSWNYIKSLIE